MDVSTMTDEERIDLANQLAKNLREGLPKQHSIAAFTLKSKLPWKVDALREALLHRMSDLSDVALDLFMQDRLLPAFIQTRAAVETVALLFVLEKQCRAFLKSSDTDAFSEFIEKAIGGSRDGSTPVTSVNILTAIDHIDKEYTDIKKMYEVLCEYTHPNWSGVFATYAVIDREKWVVDFGRELRKPPLAFGLGPLIGALSIFAHHYNELAHLIKALNDHFEAS